MSIPEFESVLRAAQAGGGWAWERVYTDVHATLVGYFRSQGGSDPEALAGDVLLRVAGAIGGFSGDYAKFRSWVFTVAHHRLIDDRRQRQRRPATVAQDDAPEPVGGDVEREAMTELGTEWVRDALHILERDGVATLDDGHDLRRPDDRLRPARARTDVNISLRPRRHMLAATWRSRESCIFLQ